MAVYQKVRSAKTERSGFLQRLSSFVVAGRSWPFIRKSGVQKQSEAVFCRDFHHSLWPAYHGRLYESVRC
ncbi:Uncharacterized protein dnm_014800 [Desulfonema magnum]|uniref:Uncharacterized protein n=1 Tax=Desulfonema magnum TaxID=45655 RepID=A0A975GLB2_9BACT|nr:Uncharacterized protein dnm_014800 [Desulfonema magnum]